MPVERKQSFDEIIASLDVPPELIPGKIKKIEDKPCPIIPDSLNLSVQAEKALPQRKLEQKQIINSNQNNLRIDNQGNKIRISTRGNILAETDELDVAWETRLK